MKKPYQGKRCVRCGEIKPLTEFYRNRVSGDGRHCYCHPCHIQANLEYRQSHRELVRAYGRRYRRDRRSTPRGFLAECFNHMRNRVLGRDMTQKRAYAGLPILSRNRFYELAMADPNFHRLYNFWIRNGQRRRDVPTVNRINPSRGYVVNNMEWLSLSDNSSKTTSNKKYMRQILSQKHVLGIAYKAA